MRRRPVCCCWVFRPRTDQDGWLAGLAGATSVHDAETTWPHATHARSIKLRSRVVTLSCPVEFQPFLPLSTATLKTVEVCLVVSSFSQSRSPRSFCPLDRSASSSETCLTYPLYVFCPQNGLLQRRKAWIRPGLRAQQARTDLPAFPGLLYACLSHTTGCSGPSSSRCSLQSQCRWT